MHILMLAQFYPPIIGGIELHVQSLAIELAARGHQIAVVSLWHKGLSEYETDHNVHIYRVRGTAQRMAWLYRENGRRHTPPFPDPEVVLALRNILLQEKPEIVHAHNWLVHSFLPLKTWSKAKLVMTLHDCSLVCAQMRLMYRGNLCEGPQIGKCFDCTINHYGFAKGVVTLISNWTMSAIERKAVDMFIPVSHAVAEGTGLIGSGLPYQVIPNFISDNNVTHQNNPEPCLSELPKEEYLLFVGDLTQDKGVGILLEAYQGLSNNPPLVLIGRKCADTPAEFPAGVMVLNHWRHDSVLAAWKGSMMGLAPSMCLDSCPTVVMEAMAAGKPVIGSNIGGIPDLVSDGETGLLVSPGDATALQQAITRLIQSPDLRRMLGKAAQAKSADFKTSNIASRIECIYQDLS